MSTPLPVIEKTYRCALTWTHPTGGHATNVFHVRTLGDVTASAVKTCWEAHDSGSMWYFTDNDASMQSWSITPLDGVTPTQTFVASGPTPLGSGEVLPALSAVLRHTTATRGKSYRGRTFLPFLGEGQILDGLLSVTARTSCLAAWDTFNNAMIADGTTSQRLVVASYKHATAANVVSFGMGAIPGTMRPRGKRLV